MRQISRSWRECENVLLFQITSDIFQPKWLWFKQNYLYLLTLKQLYHNSSFKNILRRWIMERSTTSPCCVARKSTQNVHKTYTWNVLEHTDHCCISCLHIRALQTKENYHFLVKYAVQILQNVYSCCSCRDSENILTILAKHSDFSQI